MSVHLRVAPDQGAKVLGVTRMKPLLRDQDTSLRTRLKPTVLTVKAKHTEGDKVRQKASFV